MNEETALLVIKILKYIEENTQHCYPRVFLDDDLIFVEITSFIDDIAYEATTSITKDRFARAGNNMKELIIYHTVEILITALALKIFTK